VPPRETHRCCARFGKHREHRAIAGARLLLVERLCQEEHAAVTLTPVPRPRIAGRGAFAAERAEHRIVETDRPLHVVRAEGAVADHSDSRSPEKTGV